MMGVFNHEAHRQEIELLFNGKYKQFVVIPVPLDNSGIVKVGGGDQGCYQAEGCGLMVLSTYVNSDRVQLSSLSGSPIYVRFNHHDNPFLPIGLPTAANVNFPSSYALTIGQMWFFVPASSVNPGQVVYLLLVKGVSIEAGGLSISGVVSTYVPPSANSGGSYLVPGNPWASGSKGH
jgi:hypothetical protein